MKIDFGNFFIEMQYFSPVEDPFTFSTADPAFGGRFQHRIGIGWNSLNEFDLELESVQISNSAADLAEFLRQIFQQPWGPELRELQLTDCCLNLAALDLIVKYCKFLTKLHLENIQFDNISFSVNDGIIPFFGQLNTAFLQVVVVRGQIKPFIRPFVIGSEAQITFEDEQLEYSTIAKGMGQLLLQAPNLRHIQWEPSEIPALNFSTTFAIEFIHLRSVVIDSVYSPSQEFDIRPFSVCTELESVRFGLQTVITGSLWSLLSSKGSLQELIFPLINPISFTQMNVDSLGELVNLKRLGFPVAPQLNFTSLNRLLELQELTIYGNFPESESADEMPTQNLLTSAQLRTMLQHRPSLRKLELQCEVEEGILEYIAEAAAETLKEFILFDVSYRISDADWVSFLEKCSGLERLELLQVERFTKSLMHSIGSMVICPNLRRFRVLAYPFEGRKGKMIDGGVMDWFLKSRQESKEKCGDEKSLNTLEFITAKYAWGMSELEWIEIQILLKNLNVDLIDEGNLAI